MKHVQVMEFERKRQAVAFPVASEPVSVALDPNAWVMMQATFERK